MKLTRGPRLGTKLALLGFALLIIPWFSYRQLVQMEQLLVEIQSRAILLSARNISTLFNGRDDLFNDLPVSADQFEPLYANTLDNVVRLDGSTEEWPADLADDYLEFAGTRSTEDGNMKLLLGERDDQLFAHLEITDDKLIFRDPEYLRLDNADHLRINFIPQDGDEGRVSLIIDESLAATGFAMDDQWRFAATGQADNRIQGRAQRTPTGLSLEFKFPLELLGSRRLFGVSWVDVDDPVSREVQGVTRSLPTAGQAGFNLVVLRSPEVRSIITGLGYAGARILVIDAEQRVRAEVGAVQPLDEESATRSWTDAVDAIFTEIRPYIHSIFLGQSYESSLITPAEQAAADQAILASLGGEPVHRRARLNDEQEIILAAYPIVSAETVIGTVIVEQNIDDILSFQRTALEEVIMVSVLSFFLVLSALLIFAGRLAWRIRNLRREASAAIDSYGRLKASEIQSETGAGDEIGDLSRSISAMLSRLHRHNTFLENMPRTLRHEINNPLNTMSTSLQNLQFEYPDLEDNKYLESAKRGVNRIGSIVQNLADAANLEDSLEAEEMEIIDLNELVGSYVANCEHVHSGCTFKFNGPEQPVLTLISDYRIEQLLDKIIDNAIDFHRRETVITVQLDKFSTYLRLSVANRGPTLPASVENSVFDSMVSHRGQANRLHFGLGLYVVRVIAEHHGGFVRALNLADNSGVAVVVQLPLAEPTETSIVAEPETQRVSAG